MGDSERKMGAGEEFFVCICHGRSCSLQTQYPLCLSCWIWLLQATCALNQSLYSPRDQLHGLVFTHGSFSITLMLLQVSCLMSTQPQACLPTETSDSTAQHHSSQGLFVLAAAPRELSSSHLWALKRNLEV